MHPGLMLLVWIAWAYAMPWWLPATYQADRLERDDSLRR